MKLNKLLLTAGALVLCGSLTWAQDFGDFGGFEETSSEGAASKIEVSGEVSADLRGYVDLCDVENPSAKDVELAANPSVNLNLSYSGNKSDLEIGLKVDEDTIKNHPVDVIDEAVLRGRFGDYVTLEAGKMKLVWGKGDKLHVLDNFNSDDYSDFIIPDYLDRRISTPMVRGIISLPVANLNLEGVYTPLLPVDRFAKSGRWTPAQYTELIQGAKSLVSANLLGLEHKAAVAEANVSATNPATTAAALAADKAYLEYLTYANNLSAHPDSIYPDMWNLKYSQYGARLLGTAGVLDFGVSYYYGWYKQPSVNYKAYIDSVDTMQKTIATEVYKKQQGGTSAIADAYLALKGAGKSDSEIIQSLAVSNGWQFALPALDYDRKQTFGVEAATVLWHFNVRGEFAYNLTDDIEGTDPWVHNNSIAWLGGFDIDLPFWNANLNVQETGNYILKGEECDKNNDKYASYNATDVDYSKKGYTNNKIVANFSTSFLNDKLAPEVTVMYGIERGDLVVMPKLAFKPDQNLTLTASGMIINCADEDSEFYSWRKNSFASISAKYQF